MARAARPNGPASVQFAEGPDDQTVDSWLDAYAELKGDACEVLGLDKVVSMCDVVLGAGKYRWVHVPRKRDPRADGPGW